MAVGGVPAVLSRATAVESPPPPQCQESLLGFKWAVRIVRIDSGEECSHQGVTEEPIAGQRKEERSCIFVLVGLHFKIVSRATLKPKTFMGRYSDILCLRSVAWPRPVRKLSACLINKTRETQVINYRDAPAR